MKKVPASAIKKAVQGMDRSDASLWEANGLPKLEAVQILTSDSVTHADLEAALTVDPVDADVDDKEDATGTKSPAAQSAVPTIDPPKTPEDVVRAQTAVKSADERLALLAAERGELDKQIAEASRARDEAQKVVTDHGQRSHAEQVKVIQAQTQRAAYARVEGEAKLRALIAQSGGTPPRTFPSKLDEARASRPKDSQQKANMAAFIHQQMERQKEERTASVTQRAL